MQKNKIGIWGLGIVGKSAIKYFYTKGYQLELLDQRTPTSEEQEFLKAHATTWYNYADLPAFLERNDRILPSCGIDLRPYAQYQHKWLSELDLFAAECIKPIIAITGSVGKTTVTHLLSHLLLAQEKKIFTGGNIGVGLLESIDEANSSDYVVIEVSSFQLERCTTFTPDFAICTNIFANHLDRHGSFEQYVEEKMKIVGNYNSNMVRYSSLQEPTHHERGMYLPQNLVEKFKEEVDQGERSKKNPFVVSDCEAIVSNHNKTQKILFPIALFNQIPENIRTSQSLNFFTSHIPSPQEISLVGDFHTLYYLHNAKLMRYYQTTTSSIFDFIELPFVSYTQNVVILAATLHILGYPLNHFVEILNQQELPEHRLEKIATIKGIDFYNDSKATIPASTLAAIEKIKDRPIVLFLGGVSKGVDRSEFIKQIPACVRMVYCFGKEAEQLKIWCEANAIPAQSFANLDEAFIALPAATKHNDQILFSPAGASFDLFANYAERGNYFKKLVFSLKTEQS